MSNGYKSKRLGVKSISCSRHCAALHAVTFSHTLCCGVYNSINNCRFREFRKVLQIFPHEHYVVGTLVALCRRLKNQKSKTQVHLRAGHPSPPFCTAVRNDASRFIFRNVNETPNVLKLIPVFHRNFTTVWNGIKSHRGVLLPNYGLCFVVTSPAAETALKMCPVSAAVWHGAKSISAATKRHGTLAVLVNLPSILDYPL